MTNPSIYLYGIRIDEPVTSITDILVSLVCLFAWWQLGEKAKTVKSVYYFRLFFLMMGMATLSGALAGHAFLYRLSLGWKLPSWLFSILSISFLQYAMLVYSRGLFQRGQRRLFRLFIIVSLITFSLLAVLRFNFVFVAVHSALGLISVGGIAWFHLKRGEKSREWRFTWMAIFTYIIAAMVFSLKLAFSNWFNEMDISHVLMALAIYFFYRAAKYMGEVSPSISPSPESLATSPDARKIPIPPQQDQ